eukprot:NODE_784_length_1907_cov_33.385361_g724_i0.p1 GENE.NODE_784_length_1907_cov_33.385361_g724_i0~~NODE_784_length_1907_cov_33.385361_g724_i0.p1  ORF type:complete len:248 (+),score=53.13 NODE_784_length_1907_cov_33.385361_g724_i0:1006-1749(+)
MSKKRRAEGQITKDDFQEESSGDDGAGNLTGPMPTADANVLSGRRILKVKKKDPAAPRANPFANVSLVSNPASAFGTPPAAPAGIAVAEDAADGKPSADAPAGAGAATTTTPAPPITGGFKWPTPPSDTWSCPTCMINNANSVIKCPACETMKPGASVPAAEAPKFTFGAPPSGGGGSPFGASSASKIPATFTFGDQKGAQTAFTFGAPPPPPAAEAKPTVPAEAATATTAAESVSASPKGTPAPTP